MKAMIEQQFYAACAVSPHQRDLPTLHLAQGVTQTRPGLVIPSMSSHEFAVTAMAPPRSAVVLHVADRLGLRRPLLLDAARRRLLFDAAFGAESRPTFSE